MFRLLYRVGLFLGFSMLALLIGARLIQMADPYRAVTENLIQQVAAEPQRLAQLNRYSTQANQIRQLLFTEEIAGLATALDNTYLTSIINFFAGWRTELFVDGVDTAVHKMAAFDSTLVSVSEAESLSNALAQLHDYALDNGDVVLTNLYGQSLIVSTNLADIGRGLDEVATAVSKVTTIPELEKFQQSVGKLGDRENNVVYQSIEAWQGMPSTLWVIKQQIDTDLVWLNQFEQDYRAAKAVNDRWHFDILRHITRFETDFRQPLLLGVIGNLLLGFTGWIGIQKPVHRPKMRPSRPTVPTVPQPVPARPTPRLVFRWPDGRLEYQTLTQAGELTIGNIVIRRARVRYYLESIDNAFSAHLNGNSICGARILHDGDVLQIGELQTTFQLAA